jgi:DNA adenine methylase
MPINVGVLNLERLSQRGTSVSHQVPLFDWKDDLPHPRPFLKWAGGKTHLLPVLRRCMPTSFGRYFEPFLGGGAMFFSLCPRNASLSDSNEDLIQCYQTVRDRPEEVTQHVRNLPVNEKEFYRIRAMRPEDLSDVARAARFIYLNKTCFNGLYRVNKQGHFNTPFGHLKRVTLVDALNLKAVSTALAKATVRCVDYRAMLQPAAAGDFIYMDPPYLPIGKYSDFKRYTKEQFYESDHRKLAEVFRDLAKRGCFVLLSNSHHEKIARLFAGYYQATVSVPRYVNCKGQGRGKINELLISNYPLPEAATILLGPEAPSCMVPERSSMTLRNGSR